MADEDYILHPRPGESLLRRLLRRILCEFQGHPTSTVIYTAGHYLRSCRWCGKEWMT